jgi:DNA-binding NtrC family response regulator
VGRGSVFHVFFPALEGPVPQKATARLAKIQGGTETLLLVEDEPAVRTVAAAALRYHAYRVIEAGTAAEAMRCWEEAGGKIDLVVTDLVMPGGMSGVKLADELLLRKPGLRVVYSSGYNSDVAGGQRRFEPGKNFLPKPYPLDELLAIVRRRLDE